MPSSGRAGAAGDPSSERAARLTLAALARLLPIIELLRSWGKSVEDYCLAQALAGQTVPGYKLVEGRSVRTVTELEKTVGRKAFAKLSEGCVAKPPGKPTLVTEADKRPAWNPAAEDFAGLELKD